jgi:hypothetical protein
MTGKRKAIVGKSNPKSLANLRAGRKERFQTRLDAPKAHVTSYRPRSSRRFMLILRRTALVQLSRCARIVLLNICASLPRLSRNSSVSRKERHRMHSWNAGARFLRVGHSSGPRRRSASALLAVFQVVVCGLRNLRRENSFPSCGDFGARAPLPALEFFHGDDSVTIFEGQAISGNSLSP